MDARHPPAPRDDHTARPRPMLDTGVRFFVLIALGASLGVLGARYLLVGSALSLIPWGISSIGIGWLSTTRYRAIRDAAVFGFTLAASFMVAGYQGAEPLLTRLPAFGLLGLIGALCAATLALLGHALHTRPHQRAMPTTSQRSRPED